MTDPTYRAAARFYFEPPPVRQAHRQPHAHPLSEPQEPLWLSLVVLVVVLATIGYAVFVWAP
jgi:hypothetical protein